MTMLKGKLNEHIKEVPIDDGFDYNNSVNKPFINGRELNSGENSLEYLGIITSGNNDLSDYAKKDFVNEQINNLINNDIDNLTELIKENQDKINKLEEKSSESIPVYIIKDGVEYEEQNKKNADEIIAKYKSNEPFQAYYNRNGEMFMFQGIKYQYSQYYLTFALGRSSTKYNLDDIQYTKQDYIEIIRSQLLDKITINYNDYDVHIDAENFQKMATQKFVNDKIAELEARMQQLESGE